MGKPTMKERFDGFVKFLWDSESGKVLGRGGRSWAEITLFYVVYYACLASFFAATIAVFYETIDAKEPRLQSDSSLLDGNPGMGFRPMVELDKKEILSNFGTKKNKASVKLLNTFLEQYEKKDLANTQCEGLNKPRPDDDVACKVDFLELTKECNAANEYGFAEGKPCVLIKLNKVFKWTPKLHDSSSNSLPEHLKNVSDGTFIPISCHAKESKNDDELGEVKYYPKQGFPLHYFPYKNQKDYRSPLVFVQFPNSKDGETIQVECRAYAKNIDYDRTDIQGSVQFSIKVNKS